MRFRKVAIEDAQQLASLLKEIGWFETFTSGAVEESCARVRSQLARCLADDSHSVYVAEADDAKIAGYVAVHWIPYLFMSGTEGYVSELFVREAARGQSVGRELLERVQLEARQRGCVRLSLINLRNRESYQRQFYVKAGWTERADAANFVYPMT
ncbi:MAG TPA: GNAT family N-acetyltransferase [Candidatus Binatia bacterium]